MDLIDIIKEKRFFGMEFLTWLWYQSEVNAGLIDLPGLGSVEVWLEERLVLESGSGNAKQSVTCQGKDMDLAEALTAVREGKKVSQAKLRLLADGREWRYTWKAEGLELGAVRTPKSLEPDDEEAAGAAGMLLDRVALLDELTRMADGLYAKFLSVRLTGEWEEKELPRIRKWLKAEE